MQQRFCSCWIWRGHFWVAVCSTHFTPTTKINPKQRFVSQNDKRKGLRTKLIWSLKAGAGWAECRWELAEHSSKWQLCTAHQVDGEAAEMNLQTRVFLHITAFPRAGEVRPAIKGSWLGPCSTSRVNELGKHRNSPAYMLLTLFTFQSNRTGTLNMELSYWGKQTIQHSGNLQMKTVLFQAHENSFYLKKHNPLNVSTVSICYEHSSALKSICALYPYKHSRKYSRKHLILVPEVIFHSDITFLSAQNPNILLKPLRTTCNQAAWRQLQLKLLGEKKKPKPAKPTAWKNTKEYDDLLSDFQEEACQVWKNELVKFQEQKVNRKHQEETITECESLKESLLM